MYSIEETKKIKELFWTAFGYYMKPIRGADGIPVSWTNYRTGIKHLHFRLNAEKKLAEISIQLTDPDDGMRELLFDQFVEFRALFHNVIGEEWDWQLERQDAYGKTYASIGVIRTHWSVYKKDDWPGLITFFKPRIILLDQFWMDVQDGFEAFR